MRRGVLCGQRPLGPAAEHFPAVCQRGAPGLPPGLLHRSPRSLLLYDGSLPRPLGQRADGRDPGALPGHAVCRGDAPVRPGRHGPHPAGCPRRQAEALLGHGGPGPCGADGPVLHQRHFHRLCVHRGADHRLLRPAVGAPGRTCPDRLRPLYDFRPDGLRPVPDRRHLHLFRHRPPAVPPAAHRHRGPVGLRRAPVLRDHVPGPDDGGPGHQKRPLSLPSVDAGYLWAGHSRLLGHSVRRGVQGVYRVSHQGHLPGHRHRRLCCHRHPDGAAAVWHRRHDRRLRLRHFRPAADHHDRLLLRRPDRLYLHGPGHGNGGRPGGGAVPDRVPRPDQAHAVSVRCGPGGRLRRTPGLQQPPGPPPTGTPVPAAYSPWAPCPW